MIVTVKSNHLNFPSGAAPSSELEVVSFPELLIKFKSTVFRYHYQTKNFEVSKNLGSTSKVNSWSFTVHL